MASHEQVREWMEWARANPLPQGKYPLVAESGGFPLVGEDLDPPYAQAASEHFFSDDGERERTLDLFAAELARDPTDADARFLALHFYRIAREAAELDLGEGEELARIRVRYRRELAPLIGLLRVEDCPGTWEFIEWEILNSCLVGNLDRILKLLTRAEDEKLLGSALTHAFRGQYRFVVALEGAAELESQHWRPMLYTFPVGKDYEALAGGLLLLLLGILAPEAGVATDPSQVDLLRDAAHDLEKAVAAMPDMPPVYTAALARSHFSVGRFRDAAEQYRRLLRVDLKLGEHGVPIRQPVYRCLILAHEKGGDLAAAMSVLDDEINEYPRQKGLWKRMARLKATEAQFHEVAECLRKEAENDPDVGENWMVSALIASGDVDRTLEEVKRGSPELWDGVRWVLARFWPPFHKLCTDAARSCVDGELLAALSHRPQLCPELFSKKAASEWAMAAEAELNERLFRPFQGVVLESPDLRAIAKAGLTADATKQFCELLLSGSARGLTLGEFIYVLKACDRAGPGDGIYMELREWLARKRPALSCAQALRDLQKINAFRRGAAHPGRGSGSPEESTRLSQELLEMIVDTC